ncbi:DUF1906 domain-containing protein [Phytohabitans sp. ZYX-F-186]|uniref:DUF1906 domain-containing protein n=1 Tax=Phytohabitans maris TaxID=3071409 RepID=A0ABU0ZMJ8_9ACTN|nr:glycoside hydrolase domain-containing protein [Phytohabitans sp. ZYX-F-186]MDQ7908266.1 DUF1906 domain-containing protein [Phytohabitans sp. ZYX-F-186]
MDSTVVAVAALASTLAAGLAPAPVAATAQVVSYHGYRVTVPASWRVVDLDRTPSACVRFDSPTVYLGHPGDQSTCPAGLVGRGAGLVVEPIDATLAGRVGADARTTAPGTAAAPPTTPSRDGTIQVAVESAGVLVTAVHGGADEVAVRQVLESAGLTAGAVPARLPASAQPPRTAAASPQPGTFLGRGFDACAAPSQATMDAWLTSSPYRAVGVYISGGLRACAQPNLTASWVDTQTAKGWHLIPLDVGRQAPCSSYSSKISSTPATAKAQGGDAAATSVTAAQALGIPAGSAIYADIEGYGSGASCTAAVLSYLSGWTEALHARGYLSGLYSSASSGIRDAANAYTNTGYTRVDHIWFAWWNDAVNTDSGPYAPASYWGDHQRIHQYQGNVSETWGGRSVNIDRNYLDVAAGPVEPPPPCAGTNVDFAAYPPLGEGATGAPVTAAQCLLDPAGTPSGTFDAATIAATRAFQQAHNLPVTGQVEAHTWTALLAAGDTPTLRSGSTGPAVRRLQRALTAALSRTVAVDGVFGSQTDQAVRDYQTSRALASDGVVGGQTWGALQAGR